MMLEVWEPCPRCRGEGRWNGIACSACCRGAGYLGGGTVHPGYVRVLRPIAEVLKSIIDPGTLPS
jgi:hypothetical protein